MIALHDRRTLVLFAVLSGCAQTVAPGDSGPAYDSMRLESSIAADVHDAGIALTDVRDALVDSGIRDVAVDSSVDAETFPCSDIRCSAGEICVHQGFDEDGGFRECDRQCLPAPSSTARTCDTLGPEYCRLACFSVSEHAIYCLCD